MTATPKNHIADPGPEKTGGKEVTQFKPGVSGNPAGRPKGARAKLGEAFIEGLHLAFEERGQRAIDIVAERQPDVFLKIIKDTLPREVLVKAFTATATIDLSAVEASRGKLAAYRYAQAILIGADPEAPEGAIVTEAWRADDDG